MDLITSQVFSSPTYDQINNPFNVSLSVDTPKVTTDDEVVEPDTSIFVEDEDLYPDFTDDLLNMAPLDIDEDVEDNSRDDYDLMSNRDFKILNRKLNMMIQLTEVPTQTSKKTNVDKLVTYWSKKFSDQEQKIKELVDAFATLRSQ